MATRAYQNLVAFISSRIDALRAERKKIKELNNPAVDIWIFEDKPPSARNLEDFYLKCARECDIFVLIYHDDESEAVLNELASACGTGRQILCLVGDGVNTHRPLEILRAHGYDQMLAFYHDKDELVKLVEHALNDHLADCARIVDQQRREDRNAQIRESRLEPAKVLQGSGDNSFSREGTAANLSDWDQHVLDAARLAHKSGNPLAAIGIYEKAVQSGKALDVAILSNLAAHYAEYERFDEAIDIFRAIEAQGMLQDYSYAPYGSSLLQETRYGEALPLLERALAHEPGVPALRLRLAVAKAATGDVLGAKHLLKELEETVGDRDVRLLLTYALIAEDEKDYPQALDLYRTATAVQGGLPWVWERRAISAYFAEEHAETIECIFRLQDLEPSHGLLSILPGLLFEARRYDELVEQIARRAERVTAMEVVALSQVFEVRGELEQALAEYERATRIDSNETTAFLGIAGIYRKMGRLGEALALYRQHLVEDSHLAGCWSDAGVCASHLSHHEEAIAIHKVAVRLAPTFASHHYNLACALALAGYADDARTELCRALKLDDNLRELSTADEDLASVRDSP